jgi:hypothetical protein
MMALLPPTLAKKTLVRKSKFGHGSIDPAGQSEVRYGPLRDIGVFGDVAQQKAPDEPGLSALRWERDQYLAATGPPNL